MDQTGTRNALKLMEDLLVVLLGMIVNSRFQTMTALQNAKENQLSDSSEEK